MLRKILPICAAIVGGLAMLPNAAQSATATANATAEVLTPIGIAKTTDMAFGKLYADNVATGTVTLATTGTPTAGGAVTLAGGTVTAGVFAVTGTATTAFNVTLPAGDITLNSGGNTMIVNTFVHDAGGTPTTDGAGNLTLNVGATLNVGIAQAPGVYTATFDVIANYP